MPPAISIVSPIFNMQDYLKRFLIAILSQTFTDFELICVNDGSTDNSATIIQDYAKHDKRIRLLNLKQNSGFGKSMNLGIAYAKGQTLCFADPDDLLPANSLELRWQALHKYHAVVRSCHEEFNPNGILLNHERRPPNLPEVFCPKDVALTLKVTNLTHVHWTWLFPMDLVKKSHSQFLEGSRVAADTMFLCQIFFHIDRCVWIPDLTYFYMRRKNSTEDIKYSAQDYIDALKSSDYFLAQSQKYNCIELGDMFFNMQCDYLLTSLFKNMLPEITTVLQYIFQIDDKYKIYQRHHDPKTYSGLSALKHLRPGFQWN